MVILPAHAAHRHVQVTFFNGGQSTSNSFGFSPFPLATYLSWIRPLLNSSSPRKQIIFSIGGSLEETREMLVILQAFAKEMNVVLGVECNASCPNIAGTLITLLSVRANLTLPFAGHPPPAYSESELGDFVELLAAHASPSLKVGIKLPPYTYATQFTAVINALSSVSPLFPNVDHPISFLTATNTLGQGLVFSDQITEVPQAPMVQKKKEGMFALPGGFGGLAGAAVHQLALGCVRSSFSRARMLILARRNVHRLSCLISESKDVSLQSITIIGVGGVADAAGVERMRQAGASAVVRPLSLLSPIRSLINFSYQACATALGREGVEVFAKLSARSAHL